MSKNKLYIHHMTSNNMPCNLGLDAKPTVVWTTGNPCQNNKRILKTSRVK